MFFGEILDFPIANCIRTPIGDTDAKNWEFWPKNQCLHAKSDIFQISEGEGLQAPIESKNFQPEINVEIINTGR